MTRTHTGDPADGSAPANDGRRGSYDPRTFQGLRFHTAIGAFRDGSDSPREYLERCLAVIADREPEVRAWVLVDETGARKQADASGRRWRDGSPLSPVDGLPIGIKDLLETRDMPTQMGCAAFEGNFPRRDNAAVWALRQAGAVIVGKTVTTELGGPEPSITTNPFHREHTPGGSSSGSGAAVAAAMVPATIATQTGGSLMRPASFNGNWGLKPSQGAINRGERQTASMTTHGVLAACPEDMWQIAIEIASRCGGDPGWPALYGPPVPPTPHRPATLAVMETDGWARLAPVARAAFEELLAQLDAQSVRILRRGDDPVLDRFEASLAGTSELGSNILAWEHYWAFRDVLGDRPDRVSARGRRFFIEAAEQLTAAGYEAALRERATIRTLHAQLSTRADAIIAPTSTGPAPEWHGDVPGQQPAKWPTGDPAFNFPSSLLGAPAVNVPLIGIDGLPFGVQLLGQPGTDARMVAGARWMSEALTPIVH
ncbi:amidase [Nakamurella sp. YIM 132087]|uniref:Amidase n=1 Tax=Nakamurella alba TaxID=2665158 RepID=A0A7K1FPX3_9ACTN|nr:amidase [Nakamurella alba]MTD16187.1 amidase [Nakamurella alba]